LGAICVAPEGVVTFGSFGWLKRTGHLTKQ
jgi:hypothetical protein